MMSLQDSFESPEHYQALLNVKRAYRKALEQGVDVAMEWNDADKNGTTTVYHATLVKHLDAIIEKGILPRKDTGNEYWARKSAAEISISTCTYFTTKWRHFYAQQAYVLNDDGEDDWALLPVIIKVQIPNNRILVDEDAILSIPFVDRNEEALDAVVAGKPVDLKDFVFNPLEMLADYGTCAFKGSVGPECVLSYLTFDGAYIEEDAEKLERDEDYDSDYDADYDDEETDVFQKIDLLDQILSTPEFQESYRIWQLGALGFGPFPFSRMDIIEDKYFGGYSDALVRVRDGVHLLERSYDSHEAERLIA